MTTEITTPKELQKMDPVFGQLSFDNHEQIVFCNDKDTGLKAIIGIHNSVLGPALGGTRMWNYANEWEALNDVLRLSRGMTYKSAITGLDLGGGKAVIIGDSKIDKTPEMIRKEIWAHWLAYTLIRKVIAQSALSEGKLPRQISFAGARQLIAAAWDRLSREPQAVMDLAPVLWKAMAQHRVGHRPNRVEPRAVKRRPKKQRLLMKPRQEARDELLAGNRPQ